MPLRYSRLVEFVREVKPKLIVEVGTCRGANALPMLEEAGKYHRVHYIGFDLFDFSDATLHTMEHNVKPPMDISQAIAMFEHYKDKLNFAYELVAGNTKETLHRKFIRADFAFIDGGHSYATVKGDYEALKDTPLIILDDFYAVDEEGKIPSEEFCGVNKLVSEIGGKVLPENDPVRGGGRVHLVEVRRS